MTITPEQQIRNVQACLKRMTDEKRNHQQTEEIRKTVVQLGEMLEQYFRGELEPIDDDLPF